MADLPIYLFVIAIITAVLYGLFLLEKPHSSLRTVAKTLPITLLALSAFTAGLSWFLVVALGLSAAGDAFLARKNQTRFILGLASFLIAHLAYSWQFWGMPDLSIASWKIILTGGLVGALVAGVLMHLWPHLKDLKIPVIAYTVAIAIMAITAFATGIIYPLIIGVGLFLISDIVLSHETFVLDEASSSRKITSRIIWYCYFFGQALILATFVFG